MTTDMTTAIHGHEIIHLVAEFPSGISIQRLGTIAEQRFGKDVSYHTCCAEGMNLEQLLEFLAHRYKVRLQDDLVYPGSSPACSH